MRGDLDAYEHVARLQFGGAVGDDGAAAPLDHGDEGAAGQLQLAHRFVRPGVVFAQIFFKHAELFAVFKLGRGGDEQVPGIDDGVAVGHHHLVSAQDEHH